MRALAEMHAREREAAEANGTTIDGKAVPSEANQPQTPVDFFGPYAE
jgi:hypothetical protein